MPTYIGFSTINVNKPKNLPYAPGADGGTGSVKRPIVYNKKFRMVDYELVVQDLINALNIPQGQKPGNPGYGTTLWTFMFEPNTTEVQDQIETEIRRVAELDPRLVLNTVSAYPQDQGILIELELAVRPTNEVQNLAIFFDQESGTAYSQ